MLCKKTVAVDKMTIGNVRHTYISVVGLYHSGIFTAITVSVVTRIKFQSKNTNKRKNRKTKSKLPQIARPESDCLFLVLARSAYGNWSKQSSQSKYFSILPFF